MGWSQSETARQLHMTPSAVNHILNPQHTNKPSPMTMRLFKLLAVREKPEAMNAQTMQMREEFIGSEDRAMVEKIRNLPKLDQDKVRQIIDLAVSLSKPPLPVKYTVKVRQKKL